MFAFERVQSSSLSVTLLIALYAFVGMPSKAQSPIQTQARQSSSGSLWGANKPNSDPEMRLREPVDLPDLPRFSGHSKFMLGHLRTTQQGQACLMTFQVKESPQQVMDWYTSVLSMQQWKTVSQAAGSISASKDNNRCTIRIDGSANKEYPAVLGIMYFTGKSR